MTTAEKILARASGRDILSPGEYVTAEIDRFMCHDAFAAVHMNLASVGVREICYPEKVVVALDHYVPASTPRAASIHQIVRDGVRHYGISNYYAERGGIAHQVMMEMGHVLPGDLIIGTDSHTCTYGALGAASCGIGFSEMAYALATGKLWFRVPKTIRFELDGQLKFPVSAKDIILKIAGDFSAEAAQYMAVEFSGPAVLDMSVESRMTISNMAVEIGAKFCFFETDDKTIAYLNGRTNEPYQEIRFEEPSGSMEVFRMDISQIEPVVAIPHCVDNVKQISQLERIEIHQAILGSCTNGRLEDLRIGAEFLKGRTVHPNVRLLVIPASWKIYRQAMDEGLLAIFLEAGGIILNPSCGPCFGAHMGLLAPGERCISSTNRNFKGRMGSDQAEVFLASPATVITSAVHGYIADPRES